MKHIFFIISIFVFSTFLKAQNHPIVIGSIDTINSEILQEERPIWVYVPNQETNSPFAKMKYPVLYLLDGDWHFYSVVGLTQQLGFVNGNTICPEMIIVGIPNTDRYRDLSPSCDSSYSPHSGGNENFISFLEKELIPYIESKYPVEPYKMLVGHSLGGLTVMNTLVKHTQLFNSYVAIDPSMWWGQQSSLTETEKALSEQRFDGKTLFLAIANSMEKNMDTIRAKYDNSKNTQQIRSNLKLAKLLKKNQQNGLRVDERYYQNENHASVPLIATYDALHFIFDFYNLPLTKNDFADTSMALAYRIEKHYQTVSEKMGYQVKPSENTINTLGYTALMRGNHLQAAYFFNLNRINYPESYNVYDSYGDYYNTIGDAENALKMYEKALSISVNEDTKQKIEKLRTQ